jgi:xylulose-5-phosphate/fructose-6-phosphate phosphoketolase
MVVNLVMDVIERFPKLANIGMHARQLMRDKLLEQKQYIRGHCDDMPEIRDWRWLPESSEAS